MDAAIKHPIPDRVTQSLVIFDIRALTLSARMSKITNECVTLSGMGCFKDVPVWQQWTSNG